MNLLGCKLCYCNLSLYIFDAPADFKYTRFKLDNSVATKICYFNKILLTPPFIAIPCVVKLFRFNEAEYEQIPAIYVEALVERKMFILCFRSGTSFCGFPHIFV